MKLTQDAIYVDVGAAASSRAYQSTRGGADSSAERNNVYALQPKSYIQGQDPSGWYLYNSTTMTYCQVYIMQRQKVVTVSHCEFGTGWHDTFQRHFATMFLVADPFSAPDQTTGAPANVDPFARIATLTVAIIGVGGAGVAGTAFCLYKEVPSVC